MIKFNINTLSPPLKVLLCNPGWPETCYVTRFPETHRDLPASASWMLWPPFSVPSVFISFLVAMKKYPTREERLILTPSLRVEDSGKDLAVRLELGHCPGSWSAWSQYICCQEAGGRALMFSCLPSVLLLSQPGTQVHGPVPPTFRVGLLFSAEPLWKCPYISRFVLPWFLVPSG